MSDSDTLLDSTAFCFSVALTVFSFGCNVIFSPASICFATICCSSGFIPASSFATEIPIFPASIASFSSGSRCWLICFSLATLVSDSPAFFATNLRSTLAVTVSPAPSFTPVIRANFAFSSSDPDANSCNNCSSSVISCILTYGVFSR